MPERQLEKTMTKELGSGWMTDSFLEFHRKPFAAASIGQVHMARLKSDGRYKPMRYQSWVEVGWGL